MPYLEDLLERISMPAAARDVILSGCGKLRSAEVRSAGDAFFAGGDIRDSIAEMAKSAGIPFETASLCVLLLLSERTRENYRQAGWPENLFYDTMDDFTVWARTGLRACGFWGLPKAFDWWLCKHIRRELVRLGRMQFEPSVFEADFYHGRTRDLRRGDPLLNVHVPEGEPFTREKRYDSYARAVDFFGQNLIAAETWFLYPANREILKPTSNVIGFMDDFTTVYTEVWHDGRDLWRIFGFRDSYDPKTLPRETSMQRAYAEHLERTGGETGGGYGVLLFENGRCLRP